MRPGRTLGGGRGCARSCSVSVISVVVVAPKDAGTRSRANTRSVSVSVVWC